MVIRKQLSSKDFKFQRIGVIGGMIALGSVTQRSSVVFNECGNGRGDLPRDVFDQVCLLQGFLINRHLRILHQILVIFLGHPSYTLKFSFF